MRLRVIAAIMVVLALGAATAACGRGGESGAAQDEIVIGWTPPDITGVFKTATNYFERSAADANKAGFNVEIRTRAPQEHTAFADQLAIIENFVSQQVDAIAISPADTEAIKPAIRQANEAGIPVIMVNLLEPQKDIDIASYIGFDNADAASVSAYSVLDYYGGPGVLGTGPEVDVGDDEDLDLDFWRETYRDASLDDVRARGVIIEGIAGTFFSEERLDGFNKVVDPVEGAEILAQPIAADWNREKGVSATEDFLSRFSPRQLDFIWAASNEMGLGAMSVVQRRGVIDDTGGDTPPAENKVAIFTNDVTPESVEAIKDGKIVAETHHGFAEWGWLGTKTAVQLACGQDVPKKQDIRPRTVWKGNADLYYPDIRLPDIDWAAIKAQCE